MQPMICVRQLLVMVEFLRIPFLSQLVFEEPVLREQLGLLLNLCSCHHLLFLNVHHVAAAVVVMADMLLIGPGQDRDDVVQNRIDFRIIFCGDWLVGQCDRVPAASNFRGVQSSVNMNDHL